MKKNMFIHSYMNPNYHLIEFSVMSQLITETPLIHHHLFDWNVCFYNYSTVLLLLLRLNFVRFKLAVSALSRSFNCCSILSKEECLRQKAAAGK